MSEFLKKDFVNSRLIELIFELINGMGINATPDNATNFHF